MIPLAAAVAEHLDLADRVVRPGARRGRCGRPGCRCRRPAVGPPARSWPSCPSQTAVGVPESRQRGFQGVGPGDERSFPGPRHGVARGLRVGPAVGGSGALKAAGPAGTLGGRGRGVVVRRHGRRVDRRRVRSRGAGRQSMIGRLGTSRVVVNTKRIEAEYGSSRDDWAIVLAVASRGWSLGIRNVQVPGGSCEHVPGPPRTVTYELTLTVCGRAVGGGTRELGREDHDGRARRRRRRPERWDPSCGPSASSARTSTG